MAVIESLLDHEVPADLLELYEILEFTGEIKPAGISLPLMASTGIWNELPFPKFVPRLEWKARPPKSKAPSIQHTDRGNTLHYEGPKMGSFPHESCATKVRGIQAFHMDSRGWADIAYSSLVCPHGYVYEGRGFGARTAANGTNEGNDQSYAHCYLGGVGDPLTDEAKQGLTLIRLDFEQRGSGDKQWVHGDWKATACPGAPCISFVKKDGWFFGVEPTTPDTPVIEFSEDSMKNKLVYIKTGKAGATDAGKGWDLWDPGFGRPPIITGLVVNGRDPRVEGYGDVGDVAASVRGNAVLVTAEEVTPGHTVGVHVTVA